MRSILRSTLLASCALALNFALVGCDDAKPTTPAPATTTTTNPAPADPGKGEMGGPAAKPADTAPTPGPAEKPADKDMPK